MPKKVAPISDANIKTAKSKDKQYTLNDGDGLRLIVTPKGRKYFRFDYTRPNGKRNSISFGAYPTITLAKARDKRLEYRQLLSESIDPSGYKEKNEVDDTAKLVKNISAAYLEKTKKGIGESTISNYERYIKYMVEAFGEKEIDAVTISDISKLLLKFDNEGKGETIMLLFFQTGKTTFLISPHYDTDCNSFSPLNPKLLMY